MKTTLTSTHIFLAAAVTIMALAFNASAATRYLPPGTQDQTAQFQSLINQSASGDSIVVQAGNHYLVGTVVVNKSGLYILGENGNAVRKAGNVSCIDITVGGNTIDGLYIDGGNRPEPCMRVMHCNGNQILNSTFRNSGHSGLLIHFSHLNNIQGCKAFYNYLVGISQYRSSDNTIQWCQMYENGAEGLTIDVGSHNSRVHHNWIHKNNLPGRGVGGIGIDASNGAWIYNNTIDFNGLDGIKFQNNVCCGCDGVRIYDNENISYNQGCAVKIRRTYPVTNLGFWGNTCVGNGGGNGICYQ